MSNISYQDNNKEQKEHFDQFKSGLETLEIEYEFQKKITLKNLKK